MSRDLTPWKLVVNSLYAVREPMRIEPDFWEYIYIVADKIREEIRNIKIQDDHYSIQNVLWSIDPFISKEGGGVSLRNEFRNKDYFENVINEGLDYDIKNNLVVIISKAYQTYAQR
jgi:hypothetical protein